MVRSLRWRGAMGLAMAFAAGVVLIGCAASGDADAELVRYAEARPLMGTSVRVLCYASSEAAGKAAAEAAFARATALIKVYSDYDRTSELSGLNISAGAPEGMRVSDDLLRVLTRAEYWHHKSDGAFDASVGQECCGDLGRLGAGVVRVAGRVCAGCHSISCEGARDG